MNGQEVLCRLLGSFNAYNLTAAFATATLLEEDKLEVLTALSTLESVEGRFDFVTSPSQIVGVVDLSLIHI